MIEPGVMHRNGHARCGGCLALVDRCAGGRRQRKAERWTYSGRHRLGWVCESCARWVYEAERRARPTLDNKRSGDVAETSSVRGFGARRSVVRLSRRFRKQRRKVVQAEREAPNLDAMSPSEYRRYTRVMRRRRE